MQHRSKRSVFSYHFHCYLVTILTKLPSLFGKRPTCLLLPLVIQFRSCRLEHSFSLDKVIMNGRNPERGNIDPPHKFMQSFIFSIKMIAGVPPLPLIGGLTQNSQEKLLNDFIYYLFSPSFGHHKCHHMQRGISENSVV